jgi:uncharacterized protein
MTDSRTADPRPVSTAPATGHPEFAEAWRAWHAGHERRRADPYGFLAVTGLHWLDAEPRRFDGVPGAWASTRDGDVVVAVDRGEVLTLDDGTPVTGTHNFGAIPERGGITARYGDTLLEIARRGGRDLLRPRRPDHPLRTAYRGTPAYEPDPAWVLTGRYLPFDRPRPTTVGAAVAGLEHVYHAPGAITFEVGGQPYALTAFPDAGGGLLVLFTDATSGVTTYPANRALSVAAPADDDGTVLLDFNRATNLPCAYTDFATCPLPPLENRLPIPVEAGEQIPR